LTVSEDGDRLGEQLPRSRPLANHRHEVSDLNFGIIDVILSRERVRELNIRVVRGPDLPGA
jgi:hypothetical protein